MIDSMKAVKNDVEIDGLRHAYMRDGASFVRFFAWLEETIGKGERVLIQTAVFWKRWVTTASRSPSGMQPSALRNTRDKPQTSAD